MKIIFLQNYYINITRETKNYIFIVEKCDYKVIIKTRSELMFHLFALKTDFKDNLSQV